MPCARNPLARHADVKDVTPLRTALCPSWFLYHQIMIYPKVELAHPSPLPIQPELLAQASVECTRRREAPQQTEHRACASHRVTMPGVPRA